MKVRLALGVLTVLVLAADGQTSETASGISTTPEFEPGLAAYELPPSNVDDGGAVACT